MPNFPFVVGDSLQIGTATISATGNAIVLPSGTSVGGTRVATTQEVATGGGPKITGLQVTDATWTVLDDTAVDTAGGYFIITGTNFVSGCLVYIGQTPANSVGFVSATTVRVTAPATAAGTYPVYLVNPDGGTAIRVPGINFSASPAWQTAGALPDQYDGVLLNLSLVATDATSYTLTSGSLPPGLSLNSNTGVISGTVTGVSVDTTYTFTVRATDAQLQDSPRTFTITITTSDPYFRLTTLLLTGNSGNTVVTDSSTNNFAITVVGDSRASNFSPYLTGWSNYFDGSSAYLSVADNAAFDFGAGNFTIEYWEYRSSAKNDIIPIGRRLNTSGSATAIWNLGYESSGLLNGTFNDGAGTTYLSLQMGSAFYATWNHYAVVRNGNTVTCYRNGNSVGSGTLTQTLPAGNQPLTIGRMQNNGYYFQGYISNVRLIKGTALYTANFTPATSTLTSVAGTSLLTCHANRLADGSANNFAITRNGDVSVGSFNPFNLTNSGTAGSMYFDGTGDYVLTSSTTAMNLGANPFCLEMWFYLNSTGSTYYGLCGSQTDFKGPSISRYSSVLMYGLSSNGSSWNVMGAEGTTGSTTINPYQWYHLVLCRTGNTISAYVNGLRDATVASSATLISRTEGFCIGNWYAGLYPWNGYISNVRFVVGSNPYDATQTTLTIPAAPLTAIANTQLLTLQNRQPHNNHTFQDASSNNFLITRYGNATQGTFSPFSQLGWSTLFNGSNGLSVPSNAALSFSGEFTFETFVYYNAIPGSGGAASFIMRRSNTASGSSFQFGLNNTSGQFKYFITISVGSTDYDTNWNISTPSVGRWYHVAIVRDNSSNMHCWLDGVKLILSGATSNIPGTTNVPGTDVTIGWRNYYNDLYLNGYLSNLRLSAAALYSGSTFTVPAQAFDPSQANTRLLICHTRRFVDQGSANLTIGFLNAPSIQAFSPFAPTAVYSPTIHGGSAYFDGTGDYAWCTTNVAKRFEPGSGFTFECWYYDVSGSTAGPAIFEICGSTLNWNASTGVHIQLNTNSGGTQQFQWSRGDGFTTTYGWTAPAHGQWNHFAVCYNGTTTSGWLNGNRVFTSTTGWPVPSYDRFSLGGNNVTPGSYANIYLSNLRWISGTALYNVANQTITIPTGPFASTANSILLLNFTNDAIEDATGRNVIETVADARTTSVVTKWAGSHSMYFDGTGDYLAVPANVLHNQLYATTKSFTIEFWIYLLAYAGAGVAATIISTYGGGGGADGWRIETSPNSPATNIRWVSNGADTACNATIELNTWIHYAFTYNGTTVKVFKNGALGNTATTSWTNNTGRMFIGTANAGLNFPLTAYMADIRITNAERYTTTFTPPTGSPRLK